MAPGTPETNVAEAVTGGAEEGKNLSLSPWELYDNYEHPCACGIDNHLQFIFQSL